MICHLFQFILYIAPFSVWIFKTYMKHVSFNPLEMKYILSVFSCSKYMAWIAEQMMPVHMHVEKVKGP